MNFCGYKKLQISENLNGQELKVVFDNSEYRIVNYQNVNYLICQFKFEMEKCDDSTNEVFKNRKKGIQICKYSMCDENGVNFIIDMNGIDNFITARGLVFSDMFIRKIASEFALSNEEYIRFGAAGSRATKGHPGGEVFEYQWLKNKQLTSAISSSGFLDFTEKEYSTDIPLTENGINMKEERTVYSHTAWIEMKEGMENGTVHMQILVTENDVDLLDLVNEVACKLGFKAYGVRVQIQDTQFNGRDNTYVRGRVLKHLPEKAFEYLQQATDIAIEKDFYLPKNSSMTMVGTHYLRYEPEWTKFTGGRQYEKRGHYHATIKGGDSKNCIHQTFHVRNVVLNRFSKVNLYISPVKNIYRVYQLDNVEEELVCITNQKKAKQQNEDFQNFMIKDRQEIML